VIELIDFTLEGNGAGKGLQRLNVYLSEGNVYIINTDSSADAVCFLKALATLQYPIQGEYRYKGKPLDFSEYRSILPVKKRIGYIGSDAAMISNMSIRENLLLMRYYDENSLNLSIEGVAAALCDQFKLNDHLDMRPGTVTPAILRLAITTRELAKSPELLLIEYPEEYIGQAHLDIFINTLENMPLFQMIVVFISNHQILIEKFATRQMSIINGQLVMEHQS